MKKIVAFIFLAGFAFGAESTMCFKQNWAFLADIEKTALMVVVAKEKNLYKI